MANEAPNERNYQLAKAMRHNDRAAFDALGGDAKTWDKFYPLLNKAAA